MFGLGTTELVVIGVIVFLIFGAKRLPDIGKGVGGAIREFRQIKKEINPADEAGKVEGQKESPTIEDKITEKVVDNVPGVKQAAEVKKKVEQVKNIMKS